MKVNSEHDQTTKTKRISQHQSIAKTILKGVLQKKKKKMIADGELKIQEEIKSDING